MRAAAEAAGSATSPAPRPGPACRATRRPATSTTRSRSTDGEFLLDPRRRPGARPAPSSTRRSAGSPTAVAPGPDAAVVHQRPDADPLGSQAPLFYGPIQQAKDGWNAAFFCGSNAVLRREALMQLGVSATPARSRPRVREALWSRPPRSLTPCPPRRAPRPPAVRHGHRAGRAVAPARAGAARGRRAALRRDLRVPARGRRGAPRPRRRATSRRSRADLAAIARARRLDLTELARAVVRGVDDEPRSGRLTDRDWSPLGAMRVRAGRWCAPSTSTAAARRRR